MNCYVLTLEPCQFISSVNKLDKFAGLLVWLDFTKFGRLSNTDLNETLELLQLALSRVPERAAAFVICPHLISEKVAVQGNLRGELRTAKFILFSMCPWAKNMLTYQEIMCLSGVNRTKVPSIRFVYVGQSGVWVFTPTFLILNPKMKNRFRRIGDRFCCFIDS